MGAGGLTIERKPGPLQLRQPSSVEAIERRRVNRRLAKESKRKNDPQYLRWLDEQQVDRDRETAMRMVSRFYEHGALYAIVFDFAYWQARRCGWDACSDDLREVPGSQRDANGKLRLREPDETPFWMWWMAQSRQARAELAAMSRLRLTTKELNDTDSKRRRLQKKRLDELHARLYPGTVVTVENLRIGTSVFVSQRAYSVAGK